MGCGLGVGIGRLGVIVGIAVGVGGHMAAGVAVYLPPVFNEIVIISHPRRSFRCRSRRPCARIGAAGALVVLVAAQLFVAGIISARQCSKLAPHATSSPRQSFHCQSILPCETVVRRAR